MVLQCIQKMIKDGRISQPIADELITHINKGKNLDDALKETKLKFTTESSTRMKQLTEMQTKFSKETPELSKDKQIQVRLSPLAGKGSKVDNVEFRTKSHMMDILKGNHETIAKLRNKLFNNPLKSQWLKDAIKTVYDGVERSKESSEIANMIKTVTKDVDARVGRTEPVNLINNDIEKIAGTSREQFIQDVKPLVNNSEEDIGKAYDNVTKSNTSDTTPEQNQLDFSNADNLLEYAGKYGNDVWSSFMNNLQKDAHTLAINDIFGSNRNLNKMINALSKEGRNKANNILGELDGSLNRSVTNGNFTKVSKGLRSVTSLSMLGSAALSAVSDMATILATAHYNGLPLIKTTIDMVSSLGKNKANEEWLSRQGMIAENLIDDVMGASRYDQYAGTDILSIANDKMFRVTGLTHWTNSMKNMWKRSYIEHLQTMPKQFSNIKGQTKKLMDTYGITSKDWKAYQETKNIGEMDPAVAHKFRRLINEESNYAVVEPNANVLSIMHQGTQQGTVTGELARHSGQFKSFMVATYMTHMYRALKIGTPKDRLSYATSLLAFSLPVGALVTALKDVTKGNDPTSRDYTKGKSWVDMITNSGFGGPALEMLMSSVQQGKSDKAASSLFLPASLSIVNNVFTKPVSYWIKNPEDFRTAFSTELKGIALSTPGRNMWEIQLVVNKLGRDMLLTIDPGYAKVFRKSDQWKKKNQKETGVEPINFGL